MMMHLHPWTTAPEGVLALETFIHVLVKLQTDPTRGTWGAAFFKTTGAFFKTTGAVFKTTGAFFKTPGAVFFKKDVISILDLIRFI